MMAGQASRARLNETGASTEASELPVNKEEL